MSETSSSNYDIKVGASRRDIRVLISNEQIAEIIGYPVEAVNINHVDYHSPKPNGEKSVRITMTVLEND